MTSLGFAAFQPLAPWKRSGSPKSEAAGLRLTAIPIESAAEGIHMIST
jgi:hypothetical protein